MPAQGQAAGLSSTPAPSHKNTLCPSRVALDLIFHPPPQIHPSFSQPLLEVAPRQHLCLVQREGLLKAAQP